MGSRYSTSQSPTVCYDAGTKGAQRPRRIFTCLEPPTTIWLQVYLYTLKVLIAINGFGRLQIHGLGPVLEFGFWAIIEQPEQKASVMTTLFWEACPCPVSFHFRSHHHSSNFSERTSARNATIQPAPCAARAVSSRRRASLREAAPEEYRKDYTAVRSLPQTIHSLSRMYR